MVKNIRFEYADKGKLDKERERFLARQAELWFEPFAEQLNNQSGTIDFFLKEGYENRVSFNCIEKDLANKLYERFTMFLVKF